MSFPTFLRSSAPSHPTSTSTDTAPAVGKPAAPAGIAGAISTVLSAQRVQPKGLGVRCWDWGGEGLAIVRDFFIAIFHLCTFGYFNSANTPKSSAAINLKQSDDDEMQTYKFFSKKQQLTVPSIRSKDYEEAFLSLYLEYPQPKNRKVLLNDFLIYSINRATEDWGSRILKVGFSKDGVNEMNAAPFKHRLNLKDAPADQLSALKGSAAFDTAYVEFMAQMMMRKNMGYEIPDYNSLMVNLVKAYCDHRLSLAAKA